MKTKLMTVVAALTLIVSAYNVAQAGEETKKDVKGGEQSMTVGEAYENMKRDAGTVGEKAKDAYGEAKDAASTMWDKAKKAVSE